MGTRQRAGPLVCAVPGSEEVMDIGKAPRMGVLVGPVRLETLGEEVLEGSSSQVFREWLLPTM